MVSATTSTQYVAPAATPSSRGGAASTAPPADASASQGAALLTDATAVGNQASVLSPELMQAGTYVGNRDVGVDALKSRAAHIKSLLKLSSLPAAFRARLEGELKSIMPQVQKAIAIDWLSNVASATGAQADVVRALDTASIEIVPDSELEGDAAFDEEREVIQIKQSVVDQLLKDIDGLAAKKLVDPKTGEILDPEALKQTDEYHSIAVTQALIGTHETAHEMQAASGEFATAAASLSDEVLAYRNASGSDRAAAEEHLIKEYMRLYEYDAYSAQEKFQWEMGAAPRKSGWISIDNQGNAVDQAEGVDRLYKFAMDSGTAYEVTDVLAAYDAEMSGGGGDVDGIKHPGIKHPGIKHPGIKHPGIKHPGIKHPGYELE